MEAYIQPTLLLILLIVLARAASLVSSRVGIPGLMLQILLGILIGPFLLNPRETPVLPGTWGSFQSDPLHQMLKVLSEIGLIQLIFLAGLRSDWTALKESFRPAFVLSGLGFLAAAAGVAVATRFFVENWPEAIALAAVMAVSSIGINLYVEGTNTYQPKAKTLILWSGLLTWAFGILLMVSGLALNYSAVHGPFKSTIATSWFLGKLIMYIAVSFFLISRYFRWGRGKGPERRVLHRVIGYFLLVASLYAWGAMHFGSFAAVPAAFFGGYLLIFSHPEWKDRVDAGLRSFLGSLPIGIFFIVLGMQVDFRGAEKWAVPLALATAMVVGAKIISARIALNSFLQSSRERLQVISGTLQPGEIGILIAVYLFSRGLVDPFMFRGAVTVLMALTLLSSIMMRMAGKESMNPKVKLSALKGGACGAHAGHCEERRDEGVSKK